MFSRSYNYIQAECEEMCMVAFIVLQVLSIQMDAIAD
jgi:hypothetical protein